MGRLAEFPLLATLESLTIQSELRLCILKPRSKKGRLCHSVRLMGLFSGRTIPEVEMKRHRTRTPVERGFYMAFAGCVFLLWGGAWFLFPLQGQQSIPPRVETGYVTSSDGIRLYYAKVGSGSETAIIPGRLFTFPDFQRLAKGRTLIFYDMRNRGLSDAVIDLSKISLQHDTDDLEAVRAHFGIETPNLIGFSYLGKIVVLYATQHPNHVNRIVQIGPVARKFGTKFPEALTAGDEDKVPDPAEIKRMETLHTNGFAKSHPKEFCEMEWRVEQQRMVGDPVNAGRIPSPCEMKNEWPIHLWPHFDSLLASDRVLDIPKESVAKVTVPVLTIHGTKDRNAPYGGGREWDLLLPNARLITIDRAAHMSWVEFPELVFPSIDLFLNGRWPPLAQPVKSLELSPPPARP
jgi:proline iminopeptidase